MAAGQRQIAYHIPCYRMKKGPPRGASHIAHGAAQTGKALAELIGGREVSLDLKQFSVDRF